MEKKRTRKAPTCLIMAVWASLAASGLVSPFSVSGLVPSLESVSMVKRRPEWSGSYRLTSNAAWASTRGCLVTRTDKTELPITLLSIDRQRGGVGKTTVLWHFRASFFLPQPPQLTKVLLQSYQPKQSFFPKLIDFPW